MAAKLVPMLLVLAAAGALAAQTLPADTLAPIAILPAKRRATRTARSTSSSSARPARS